MKKFLLVIISLFIVQSFSPVFAVSNTMLYKNASNYYEKQQYRECINILESILEKPSDDYNLNLKAISLLSHSYFCINEYDKVFEINKKIINLCTNKSRETSVYSRFDKYYTLRDAYLLNLHIIVAKIDQEYKKTHSINDSLLSEFGKGIISFKYGYDVKCMKSGALSETSELFIFAEDILKEYNYEPILKIKLLNTMLPYMREGHPYEVFGDRATHLDTNTQFFYIYASLVNYIVSLDDSYFTSIGKTKIDLLNKMKSKINTLNLTDYEQDFCEALYCYYTLDKNQAKNIISDMKTTYTSKNRAYDTIGDTFNFIEQRIIESKKPSMKVRNEIMRGLKEGVREGIYSPITKTLLGF